MKHILTILFILIGQNVLSQDIPEDNNIYHMLDIDKRPEYSQGWQTMRKFIVKNFDREGLFAEKKGRLTIRLLIEKDGTVSKTDVLENIGPGSDKEIMRVFKELNAKWIPGQHEGKIVRSYYVFTITL